MKSILFIGLLYILVAVRAQSSKDSFVQGTWGNKRPVPPFQSNITPRPFPTFEATYLRPVPSFGLGSQQYPAQQLTNGQLPNQPSLPSFASGSQQFPMQISTNGQSLFPPSMSSDTRPVPSFGLGSQQFPPQISTNGQSLFPPSMSSDTRPVPSFGLGSQQFPTQIATNGQRPYQPATATEMNKVPSFTTRPQQYPWQRPNTASQDMPIIPTAPINERPFSPWIVKPGQYQSPELRPASNVFATDHQQASAPENKYPQLLTLPPYSVKPPSTERNSAMPQRPTANTNFDSQGRPLPGGFS